MIPVYNEEECIIDVIQSWEDELCRLHIDFIMIILNDGSTDGTEQKLSKFTDNNRIIIINKENTGHGPTILLGYHEVIDKATWVFQTDSDNEIKPEYFAELWNRRDEYDGLFGIRENQQRNMIRKIISTMSSAITKILYGKGVVDVNIPYRLIRCEILKKILSHIPSDTISPNIMISGTLSAAQLRIFNYPLKHEGRRTGKVSIVKWKLIKVTAGALWQTIKSRSELKKVAFNINTLKK